MRAIGIAMWMLWFGHQMAFAQGTAGATDNELYAAYCIGVLDDQIQGLRSTFPTASGQKPIPELEQALQRQLAPVMQSRQRFAGYLASTGALTDPARDVWGLMVAQKHGREDYDQCLASLPQCAVTTSVQANVVCIRSLPPCSRASRCQLPDVLPF